MTSQAPLGAAPGSGPPVIPTPPQRVGGPRRRGANRRWLLWLGAIALGVGAGMSAYRWLPPAKQFFDYWLARLL